MMLVSLILMRQSLPKGSASRFSEIANADLGAEAFAKLALGAEALAESALGAEALAEPALGAEALAEPA
jgi:hypothetical protein